MRNRFASLFPAVCIAVVLFSCHQADVVIDIKTESSFPGSVHKLDVNNAGYGLTRLEGLSAGDDIYLVKVKNNRIRWNRSMANSDGEQEREEGQSLAEVVTTETGETFLRYERHWQVTPPLENTQSRNRMRASVGTQVGDKRSFFVDISSGTAFTLKTATLKKIGTYCKVWVVDGYEVGAGAVTALAEKFDEIYPLETNLLGYEYGGGPGGNGGMDGDPKVQILLFDIDGDGGGFFGSATYGYFYPGDEFERGETYPCSNEAEIFYLDSVILQTKPKAIYSTLIHEFNHMINFNLKVLQGGEYLSWNTEVWYTEMLSMLAEDVIGPLVGIVPNDPNELNGNQNHVINVRIPDWIRQYADVSVMYWPSSGNTLPYYSSNYAFGAYLVRNFGGPALFSAIAKSKASGRGSLDGSLRKFNGVGIDTYYAMSRFGEALLYSDDKVPEGCYTFDKEITGLVGGETYTFPAFDIWSDAFNPPGPLIRKFAEMSGYAPDNTVQLYQDSGWTEEIQASGGLTIRLLNVETDAEYYILTKPKD
ncbi:MAG: hypothetical protein LBT00_06560 [Spirochaetaceae bacterium]|jgi:hypothetical protein|nr:hypothetical protein [Spirochaetaceae bacterium]